MKKTLTGEEVRSLSCNVRVSGIYAKRVVEALKKPASSDSLEKNRAASDLVRKLRK
ncbi:hypothetical protein [Mesotoga sp. H07pep.5.4]|uniref:hypothetical protein n=1 Tax=Mesotoga sp. H07pep.5.4 TaxID=1463664 RepID=UPI0016043447|nr:hypothetical protein [Mesotoga sp. H07pep.5.4]